MPVQNEPPPPPTPGIFRAVAVRHYMQCQEECVEPRYVDPPVLRCVALLIALLILAAGIGWIARAPEYAIATAVRVDSGSELRLSANFPRRYSAGLRVGQTLTMESGGAFCSWSIVGVQVKDTSVAVTARLLTPVKMPASEFPDIASKVRIEIGSRPVLSLLAETLLGESR